MNRGERLLLQTMKDRKKQEPKYLTEFHRKNYEAGMKQITEWQEHPPTLEEALAKQKEREK